MREVNRLGRPPHMRGRTHTRPGRVVSRASASACAGTGSTATGRCASRRTRTARAGAALAGGLMGQHRNSRLRTCGAAAMSAAPKVTGGTRLRMREGRSSIPTGRSRPAAGSRGWSFRGGDNGVRRGLFSNEAGRSFRGGRDDPRLGRARSQRPACHPGHSPVPRPMPGPGRDVARCAGLSLPAHGPSSSRGSAPGFPFRGNSLLRQSDRPRAP